MDVRRTAFVATLLLSLSSLALGQGPGKKQGEFPQNHEHKRDNSFFQYTLNQINPANVDYGSRWAGWRRALVDRTFASGYFWSNALAVSLLVCLFLAVLYQRNLQNRRHWAMAEIVAQYEHALTRANVQIEELTSKNYALAQIREQEVLSSPTTPSVTQGTPPANESPFSERLRIEPGRTAASKETRQAQKPIQVTEKGSQITLFTPDVDLMMTVNSLKQQLAHAEEKNTLLQRRIASASRARESKKQSGGNALDVRSVRPEQEEHSNGNRKKG